MGKVTEQQILSMAPNSSAVANARKISAGGGFVSLSRTEDDTFYMGECKGSGKSNYTVSADFIEAGDPVCRCSCPSRQFPCKHSLALLFEIEKGKTFSICRLPDAIKEKREKKEQKAAKNARKAAEDADGAEGTAPAQGKAAAKRKKAGSAARVKKMKKQLEGIRVLRKLTDSLLQSGLGTLNGISLKSYRELAKQLGDYYLPGPQILFNRLILEAESYQEDGERRHQEQILQILIRLNTLVKKAESYLLEKIEKGDGEDDDSILYEELGGIWNLERLNQLGRSRENAELLQLSFEVYFDGARKEWIDRGYYVDCSTGEIVTTFNYRPVKALKYVKQEDSTFAALRIPVLTYYPGNCNPRVRWEHAEFEEATKELRKRIRGLAEPELASVVKKVKNLIKNPLDAEEAAVLVAYRRIGVLKSEAAGAIWVLEDEAGDRIVLRDGRTGEKTVAELALLPHKGLLEGQAVFGKLFYDSADHRICMQPLSIVTEQAVIRLAY